MGVGGSKTSTEIINEAITEVIFKSAQRCSGNVTSTQIVKHTGWFSGFTYTGQDATISLECLQNVRMTAELVDEIVNNIKQEAAKNSVVFAPDFNRSDSDLKIRNLIETRLSNEAIQECAAKAAASQYAEYGSVINIGLVTTNSIKVYAKCFSETLNDLEIATTLVSKSEQSSRTKSDNPLQPIADIFGGWGNMLIAAGAIIFLVVIVIFAGGGGSSEIITVPVPAAAATAADTTTAAATPATTTAAVTTPAAAATTTAAVTPAAPATAATTTAAVTPAAPATAATTTAAVTTPAAAAVTV